MSPDLDAGLLRGVDDPRVVDLGGRRHRHRRRSADHSCPENEINCSPSSPVSSVHASCHSPDPLSPNSDAPYDGHRDVLAEGASHTRPVGSSVARPLFNTRTAIRALPRSNVRSTSSPLDTASPAPGAFRAPTGKPSVKDLKKRFDQGGDAASASKSQVRPSNAPLRATRPSGKTANGALETRAPNANAPMQAALESGAATRAQRSKLVAQSAVPGSSQSFASRIAKPRGSNLGKVTGSKSLTQLPQRVPHQHLSSLPPTTSRPPGLLFGEVTPGPHAAAIAGFGIRGARPSRTSTSGNYSLAGHHHRSISGSGAESPSPSSWYVDALEKQSQTPSSAHSRPRTRSRSDAAASLASIEIEISHDSSPGFSVSLNPDPSPSASKLPVSVRRMSGPVSQTSPSSSRSTSPSAFKCSLPSSRIPGATSAAASRASASVIRAKTPTGRKPPPQPLTTPDKNARLQAYIAAPPPKLSPPLRSSRPRMPISTATTLGLGIKDTSRQSCVDAPAPSGPSKVDNGPARRRKISFGPIDFEQRREHIRLAYSKSIRESKALEERQVAAERRRRESEEATKAFAAAETTPSASVKVTHGTSVAGSDVGRETEMDGASENRKPSSRHFEAGPAIAPAQQLVTAPVSRPVTRPRVPPLTVRTALDSKQDVISQDSPTLGVPGGFSPLGPSANSTRQPLSALSATSETTEFNVEPQTNPPIQTQSPLDVPITVVKPPSPERAALAHQTGYRYSFKDEATQPVKSLKTAEELASAADTRDTDAELPAPGGFSDELEESALPRRTDQPRGTVAKVVSQTGTRSGSISDSVTAPFPRMDTQDESDCHSDLGTAAQGSYDSRHDDGATDACTEETDDVDRSGHRRSDFRRDELYSHRTSACTSSDAGAFDDDELGLQDPGPIVNASNLAVPLSRLQTDRLSQQSAWTDFSVDSTDPSDNARSSTRQSGQESPSFGHFTIFESRRAARESALYKDTRFATGLQRPHGPKEESIHTSQTQLPEVDTGGGFFVPSLSPGAASASPSFIPSPDHELPPVPVSAPASTLDSRTSSAFYEQSHYGSTLINSEREAGDFTSSLATPQSLDAATTETGYHFQVRRSSADDSAKLKALEDDGKERHRLVQRHNVIKELVDTEAVFVRDMNIVEEIYKGTAEACPKLDSKTVKLIFRNSSEIIDFHTYFLKALKEAVTSVYVPAGESAGARREESTAADQGRHGARYSSDGKDRMTSLGPVFQRNMESMKLAHEGFLRNSDQAAKRLIQIQQDPTVKVWLNECNEVAKDLTAAWDLDSLLIKPMQRITKYPNLIMTLLQHTPQDHPDREALVAAKDCLETAIIEINKNKKNFELVGQIVGRKRKESDSKAGFARAFGKRVDKLQASNNRPPEDPDYAKLNDKFGDDYLRLQVVLRDVEFYTRQVSAYVHEFLQYLSSVELVMRLQPGNYPELESKWVQFNISVRDLEKVALEEHLTQVRKHVIEPFELVIKAYGNPALAMKKRQKRRLDYERSEQLKRSGRTADPKLRDLVEQYEALNDTLKKELPTLSALTEKVGNICLGNFVNIQTEWYAIWKDKMKMVLGDCPEMPDLQDVVSTFQRDYPYARDQLAGIGILNPTSRGRLSQSTSSVDDSTIRSRGRGFSVNGDAAPTLPAPDFGGRRSGSFSMSPGTGGPGVVTSSPQQYHYRDYYAGIHAPQGTAASSARSPEMATSSRSVAGTGAASTRPSTGRSLDSGGGTRQSSESANQQRRDPNTTYNSSYVPHESRRYSNIFHSALPLPDGPEDSRRSSRASSRERNQTSDGYNILWLAASLFEFNISTTKQEAGYPYLTYQAGEIFDVIAEKGELWLAKNQDNATDQVGWIWSKHFAKLADS